MHRHYRNEIINGINSALKNFQTGNCFGFLRIISIYIKKKKRSKLIIRIIFKQEVALHRSC